MRERTQIDPRLRVLYLLAVACGVFLLKRPWQIGALIAVQGALWLAVGLCARRLVRQAVKLWGFAAFIVASYALTAEDPLVDAWTHVRVWRFDVALNYGGAVVGAMMVLRVLCVVLASQVARAGDSRAVAAGLDKLGVPNVVAGS